MTTYQWIGTIIVIMSFIGTWLYQAFGSGRQVQKVIDRVGSCEDEVEEVKERQDKLEQQQRADVARILAMFVTAENEPRLVSYKSLRHILSERQTHILTKIDHINGNMESYRDEFKEVKEKLDTISKNQAVLMADREREVS